MPPPRRGRRGAAAPLPVLLLLCLARPDKVPSGARGDGAPAEAGRVTPPAPAPAGPAAEGHQQPAGRARGRPRGAGAGGAGSPCTSGHQVTQAGVSAPCAPQAGRKSAGAPALLQRCGFAEGCDAGAGRVHFGVLGREQRFCRDHRQASHHNLNNFKARRLCRHPGCGKLGTFGANASAASSDGVPGNGTASSSGGVPGDRAPALYCKRHSAPGERAAGAVSGRLAAARGVRGERPDWQAGARLLLADADPGSVAPADFIDVRNRRCRSPGCWRRARYGTPGAGDGVHSCQEHRAPEDTRLGAVSGMCVVTNCSRAATFGAPGAGARHAGGKPLRCAHHRDASDVDVRNRRCEAEMTGWDLQEHRPATLRCPQRATFGNPAEGCRRFCSQHRRRWDTNLNNKKTCAAAGGCSRTPSFCDPATRRAQYCGRHRPAGFVHTSMLHKKGGAKAANADAVSAHREPDSLWFRSATASQPANCGAVDLSSREEDEVDFEHADE